MTDKPTGQHHTKRDAEILVAIGAFLIVLAIPVLIGTFMTGGLMPALVNLAAGTIVGGIGALMVWRGRWTRRHLD